MKRKTTLYLVFIVLGIALFVAALVLLVPSAMTAKESGQAASAETKEFVGQVTEITDNILTVEILESLDGGESFTERTGQFIYVVIESQPEYVMGSQMDLVAGALGQFQGVMVNDRQMTLKRIVILTNFVDGPSQ